MKRPRLLIVAMLAGAGLALWAASGVQPGDTRSGEASLVADPGVQPPSLFSPIVLVAAEMPADEAPLMLTPPPAPEPPTPVASPSVLASGQASGVPAKDRLQFTVLDVPSAEGAKSSVVRLPPLPEPLPPGDSTVHRLPPEPEQDLPATPASAGTGQSQDAAVLIPAAATPAASTPAASVAVAAVPTGPFGAGRPELPSHGPALEPDRDAAASTAEMAPAPTATTAASVKRAPQTDNPFAAAAGADQRPLAELLREAGGNAADPTASGLVLPKAVETPSQTEALPWSPPPFTNTSQTPTADSPMTDHGTSAGRSHPAPPEKTGPPAASSSAELNPAPPWAAPPPMNVAAGLAPRQPTLGADKQEKATLWPSSAARPSDGPRPASPRAMQAVLLKADAHMQQGIDLADRRAFYSARTEFLAALRLLAQGLDAQDGGTARSEALARGIWALEEVNDFIPRGSALNADIRVDRLVAAHRTTVLKSSSQPAADSSAAEVTPLQAVQKYYTYAQEQLAVAVRPSREGSQLLTALGKLYAEMNGEPARLAADAATKGLVCQQAALLADGNNARAANELGVLLAREGRFEEARDWLRHSARLKQQSETWHNLAVVHASLGEPQLAAAARNSSLTLARRQGQAAGPQMQVKQVTPAQFAGQSRPAGPAPALASPPANGQTPTTAKAGDVWDWLPWR